MNISFKGADYYLLDPKQSKPAYNTFKEALSEANIVPADSGLVVLTGKEKEIHFDLVNSVKKLFNNSLTKIQDVKKHYYINDTDYFVKPTGYYEAEEYFVKNISSQIAESMAEKHDFSSIKEGIEEVIKAIASSLKKTL